MADAPHVPPSSLAPDSIPGGRDFLIEEWKSTQQSAELFDDLGLRMRTFGVGGVFLIAGYGVQTIKDDRVLFALPLFVSGATFHLHSSALIILISVCLLGAVYLFDRRYYFPLLIGAVVYAQEIERLMRGGVDIVDQGGLARINVLSLPGEKRPIPESAQPQTHIYGKTGFVSYYVSKVHPGLQTNLDLLYFILTAVLFEVFLVLNFPNRWTPPAFGGVGLVIAFAVFRKSVSARLPTY
jgi:hypothetical protein